jgi:hypothetical protein
MLRSHGRFALTLAALALSALVLVVVFTAKRHADGGRGDGDVVPTQHPPGPAGQAARADRSDTPSEGNSAAPPHPLLVDDFASLQGEADAGDADAACRLGYKLLRCAASGPLAADRRFMEDPIPPDLDPPNVAHLLAARPAARQFVALCRQAPTDSRSEGWRYAREAALSGDPAAMFHYARGDGRALGGFGPESPQFQQWLEEAPDMLERAFQAGHLPAVFLLWEARIEDGGANIRSLVPNDPLQGQALEYLMSLLHGRGTGERDMGWIRYPQVAVEAEMLAREWHRRYFHGRANATEQDFRLEHPRLSDIFPQSGQAPAGATCATR